MSSKRLYITYFSFYLMLFAQKLRQNNCINTPLIYFAIGGCISSEILYSALNSLIAFHLVPLRVKFALIPTFNLKVCS